MKEIFRKYRVVIGIFVLIVIRVIISEALSGLYKKDALEEAAFCLKTNAYSYKGLYDQLIMEGYDEEKVIRAIEVLQVDWKIQALRSANYPPEGVIYEITKEDLIERLKKEGFTDEEITYAAER